MFRDPVKVLKKMPISAAIGLCCAFDKKNFNLQLFF